MKDATLLLMNSSLVAGTGWSELNALRRLGVARVVIPHPYRGNGAVVTIALRRPTVWRASMNLLGLLRLAFGRLMFVRAKPEQGKMWIAGPLADIAATDEEVSDRFALFEGIRQLPPIPVSLADIRLAGGGRYSVRDGSVFFSSTKRAGTTKVGYGWWSEIPAPSLGYSFCRRPLRRSSFSIDARS